VTRGTLLQVLPPLAVIGVILIVLRARGLSPREELALRPVRTGPLLAWVAAFVVLAAAEELAAPSLGIPPAEPWGARYGPWDRVLRTVGIIAIAPVAEELVFRGLIFTRLSRTRLRTWGAIVATALLFTAVHVQYGWPELAFVLVDGLFYAGARAATGTVAVSLVCNVLGNTYAALERLAQ